MAVSTGAMGTEKDRGTENKFSVSEMGFGIDLVKSNKMQMGK